jgi:adenine deaminase
MASDHECWTAQEVADKLRRGLFIELRPHSATDVLRDLVAGGQQDWSQFALCTDDRSAPDTLRLGATDHNLRQAIAAGVPVEAAIQMVTINPARHMRLTPWVGSIAPGRFADLVLVSDVGNIQIDQVWADGQQVSDGTRFLPPVPQIDWPDWARQTVRFDRPLTAADFAIRAPGRQTVKAALLRPFHWSDDFITADLAVVDGEVQRDTTRNITKFAVVDRYSGSGAVGRMFWLGTGPATPDSAVACSMGHDSHNIWATGSSDAAMALAVNTLNDMQGGWALVRQGSVVARVHYEIGGLMTCRPAASLRDDMDALYAEAAKIDWMYEPTFSPRWWPGFPERLGFATLTCAPWRWVLVAPTPLAPDGFVNVATGQTHPVVW